MRFVLAMWVLERAAFLIVMAILYGCYRGGRRLYLDSQIGR